jgi:alcohol dehydrogenase, propanol-preferring
VPATATYKAVQVSASGELELTERPLVDPAGAQVRIRVEACGVCHTDAGSVHSHPAAEPGIVPGHEVVGTIDAVGAGVTRWQVGDRVGVGFLSGPCGHCAASRHGNFTRCEDQPCTGLQVDGGYAEYMIARESGLVSIPAGLSSAAAAPLLCAGLTVYNALLQGAPRPGSTAAILGIGGLGHLGIQYADKMGLNTVAIARGHEKEKVSRQLGADHYVDATEIGLAAAALCELGGADLIVATASSGTSSSALVGGLATNGKLIVVGASEDPVTVSTGDLIGRGIQVLGSLTGTPAQNEENLAFAEREGIHALIEEEPLENAAAAFSRMLDGRARYRMVLRPGLSRDADLLLASQLDSVTS